VQYNELPVIALFEGLCLIFAGALLLTPGFITDAVGFVLLIPPLRQGMAEIIIAYLVRSGGVKNWSAVHASPNGVPSAGPGGDRKSVV